VGFGLIRGRGLGGWGKFGEEVIKRWGCVVVGMGGGGGVDACGLRVRCALTSLWAWLVSSRTRQVTFVSNSPVTTYFICDCESASA
jgi:hypothetical protein